MHFADRPIRDYRSAYMSEGEAKRQSVFNLAFLNRGILAAGYGLMALSLPMTDADIESIVRAASDALAQVASKT
ncbi:hypothetical protein [Bradyrhizobium pachyrhizi]|uniref:hypothetical protein n=1 Tax=Bradyrhizobium pachyrhizi TaxID=280333 RepID=UPI001FD56B43|nr:hypothetical protein [Bradyrhizobium pachyrhizi]